MLLRNLLRAQPSGDLRGLALQFHNAQAKLFEVPWQLACALDYRVPGFEGGKMSVGTKMMHCYLDGVTRLLPHSPTISLTFLEVINMFKKLSALFHPGIALQVLTKG